MRRTKTVKPGRGLELLQPLLPADKIWAPKRLPRVTQLESPGWLLTMSHSFQKFITEMGPSGLCSRLMLAQITSLATSACHSNDLQALHGFLFQVINNGDRMQWFSVQEYELEAELSDSTSTSEWNMLLFSLCVCMCVFSFETVSVSLYRLSWSGIHRHQPTSAS